MKTTRISIKNLLGIKEMQLGSKSVEISGKKGAGKTSVLDAIRVALTNKCERDWIVRNGETEGEILIETDSGLFIDRKIRTDRADYVLVKDGRVTQNRPAEYLNQIFTPLQLNPIEFTRMSRQEKNRVILSLIEFDWDMEWIRSQFGEIPAGIDYDQHILQILEDIQADNGEYYRERQDINRRIRFNDATILEISKVIPEKYEYQKWKTFDMSSRYRKLEEIRSYNNQVEKARAFKESYKNKLNGLTAEREISINTAEREVSEERQGLALTIERLRAEIRAAEEKLSGLDDKLKNKVELANSKFDKQKAELERDLQLIESDVNSELVDASELTAEINTAENMRKFLNEYERLLSVQKEKDELTSESTELTRKIELARELPGEILKQAKIPIEGLTVKDGVPLIDGLPVSNRSDGELLELCVDITISKPGSLQIILINGVECLDTDSREKLYAKCREKGLQFIATRVSDNELEVTEL